METLGSETSAFKINSYTFEKVDTFKYLGVNLNKKKKNIGILKLVVDYRKQKNLYMCMLKYSKSKLNSLRTKIKLYTSARNV